MGLKIFTQPIDQNSPHALECYMSNAYCTFFISYGERSILARNDLIQLEGVVKKVLGRGGMEIECDNNVTVRAVLSGRMKKNRIRVIEGDRVQVSVSPYDTTHGIITYRFK